MPTRLINQQEVRELLPMAECIEIMADALKAASSGEAVFPLRRALRIPKKNALFALMPGIHPGIQAMGAKAISVFPENHGSEFESHQGVVLLFDTEHGEPKAIIDGNSITEIRTAAVSGVATKCLARPGASVLAILGSGVQAKSHLEAMLAMREIKQVKIWSRNRQNAEKFLQSIEKQNGIRYEASHSVQDAVRTADIICTTTAAREPVLQAKWLAPGAHINAVGASTPATRELDSQAILHASVFVDCYESAFHEAGEIIIPQNEGLISKAHIRGEIGEILLGKMPGRTKDDEITVFKSLGIAVEDIVAADYIYQKAVKSNIGLAFNFSGGKWLTNSRKLA
jgi:ornithine cyclodeaminase